MSIQFTTVIENRCIADKVYLLRIKGDFKTAKPGQFVGIKIPHFTLRRPISINQIHNDGISMIYKILGDGTDVLSKISIGSQLDVLGPLGNGYDLDQINGETIVLFGGGVGVPPMYELSKQLTSQGKTVTHILGFQSAKDVFFEKEFMQLGPTYITTVDGSYGIKGFVSDVLDESQFDFYCACGPEAMLHALQTKYNVPGFISIENRMACGIGACYACVCDKKDGGQTRVCIDGPVYPTGVIK